MSVVVHLRYLPGQSYFRARARAFRVSSKECACPSNKHSSRLQQEKINQQPEAFDSMANRQGYDVVVDVDAEV